MSNHNVKPLNLHLYDAESVFNLVSRIAKRVTPTHKRQDVCWTVGGWSDGKGYRKIRVKNQSAYTHRVMYEALIGPIPEGMVLDHGCRNRSCCNPYHLEPVTNEENILRGNWADYRFKKKEEVTHDHNRCDEDRDCVGHDGDDGECQTHVCD